MPEAEVIMYSRLHRLICPHPRNRSTDSFLSSLKLLPLRCLSGSFTVGPFPCPSSDATIGLGRV